MNEQEFKEYMKLPRPTKDELMIADKCLRKLIDIARVDMEQGKDSDYYTKRYKGLLDAQAVVNGYRSEYVTEMY
jgi:hypothetical protein